MLVETGLDTALNDGYRKLRQTIVQAQGIRGFAYPHIMVNMTELARMYDHDRKPKRALDVINAALDTWCVIMRRHQVPVS